MYIVLTASFNPKVFITSIQIANKILAPGDQTGVLKETIENTRSITLSYLQDVVTLEFSALDFTAPQQNKYRYQLLGIDKEWVESGTRRAAIYVHLPAGNYTFKVQGNNKLLVRIKKLLEMRRNLQQYYLKKAGIHRISLMEHMLFLVK